MKGMFLKKCDIYYQKCATAAQRFQLSMTKLGACDEIRWNDGTVKSPNFVTFFAQNNFFLRKILGLPIIFSIWRYV